jgi:phage protein D
MTTLKTLYSLKQSFYVPHFEVWIKGGKLPDDIVRDVLLVTYQDSVNEIDSFELLLNNWDAQERAPKYVPFSRQEYEGIFDPGQKVELWMGYLDDLHLMVTGEITTLEPSFSDSSGVTLSVRGLSNLHTFRAEQHTFSWTKRRDSDIARELGGKPITAGQPGLNIRVETRPLPEEIAETYVFMNNQYDIVFLLERARRHGYELMLVEEERDGRKEQYLYFGPSQSRSQPQTYQLEWGKSLISFRPTLSTVRQVAEVVVRGWNRRSKQPIEERATWRDLIAGGGAERTRMERLAEAFRDRREIITDQPVHTKAEAKALARGILRRQLQELVQAHGAVVGLPLLRAGHKVHILGVGDMFTGAYFITQAIHTIGDHGYCTEFQGRREGPVQQSA